MRDSGCPALLKSAWILLTRFAVQNSDSAKSFSADFPVLGTGAMGKWKKHRA
jgi:hypothetical protein